MKIIIKALIASALVILIIISFPVLRFIFEMVSFDNDMEKQMKAGRKYMDSLTDKDIQAWIQRTPQYLKEYDPKTDGIGFGVIDAPPELQKLAIEDICVWSNEVDYAWLGGMDHTELDVRRMDDGGFQVTAVYNNYSNRVIWPKQ